MESPVCAVTYTQNTRKPELLGICIHFDPDTYLKTGTHFSGAWSIANIVVEVSSAASHEPKGGESQAKLHFAILIHRPNVVNASKFRKQPIIIKYLWQ